MRTRANGMSCLRQPRSAPLFVKQKAILIFFNTYFIEYAKNNTNHMCCGARIYGGMAYLV
jgi:hypothetical protein